MSPSFSVVIPLYNKAPHVEAAVESALSQSWQPAEVIVIDDGSTDGGLDLVRRLEHPALKVMSRSPPGPGGYAARNLGVTHAQSEWVAFLDADDLWHKDHLRRLAETISGCGAEVGCAFSGVELVYRDRREVRRCPRDILIPNQPLRLDAMLRAWLRTGECPLWTGAVALRRQLLIEAGLFPAGRARRGGDKDLWIRAMAMTNCVCTGSLTAEFHQATVNRVSDLTPHADVPIISETIDTMVRSARPNTADLLKKVANLELATYARCSAGRGAPIFLRFARRVYFPGGLPTLAKIAAYYLTGLAIRHFGARSRS